MSSTQLSNISPIDGRYYDKTRNLSDYFSEFALFKYRIYIEIEYLLFLTENNIAPKLSPRNKTSILNIVSAFNTAECQKIKTIENKIKHDVKAVEYYISQKLADQKLSKFIPWIHFGLTSEDINQNAYRLMLQDSTSQVLIPEIKTLLKKMHQISRKYNKLPMLARTHGQPAVPTTFGKEMLVFVSRLEKQFIKIGKLKLFGKLGGSVGNWNSLVLSQADINWPVMSGRFLKRLGLRHSVITTQIAPPEDILELLQSIYLQNLIIIDLSQDMWRYISDGWIKQIKKPESVGSSAMPQKINPIEFENTEGNLIVANGLIETLIRKLGTSRLQRDLSESTVYRNFGSIFAYCLIAYKSLYNGLSKIAPNKEKIEADLNCNWNVLSEALHTILRKEGKLKSYEKISKMVKGKQMRRNDWINMIKGADIQDAHKNILLTTTPNNYIGLAAKLDKYVKKIK